MADTLQAIRGMNDILPEKMPYWQKIENAYRALALRYGYHEIRFPIVESTQLFKRTIGEVTDIVEKEMYTFTDRNGDSLSLRPEGTAGCVRAGIQQGLFYNQVQRLWYAGPMFRHERPQKGRYRQFFQFGLEAFGMAGPDIDVEQILFAQRLFKMLGLQDTVNLQINTLGTRTSRNAYRDVLVKYFADHINELDEDSKRRLSSNPLRILDSKNPDLQELIKNAPQLCDYLDDESSAHFKRLCELLDAVGVEYTINPQLVRGLDYYCHTVYEWVTESLGAQGTVCAGGRYDVLVEQLGGRATPACGFAFGMERAVLLMEQLGEIVSKPDVCFVLIGDAAVTKGLVLAEQLRSDMPNLKMVSNLSAGSFKSQFKRADKSGARWALIIADEELENKTLSLKDLRGDTPQQSMSYEQLLQTLREPAHDYMISR